MGKTKSEVREVLESEITIWLAEGDSQLISDFGQVMIPRTAIVFDVDQMFSQYHYRIKRTFIALLFKSKNDDFLRISDVFLTYTDETKAKKAGAKK